MARITGFWASASSARTRVVRAQAWLSGMLGCWDGASGDQTVGLDGVPDQQANYGKSGLVMVDETARHSGVAILAKASLDPSLIDLTADNVNALTHYDALF